MEKMCLNTFNVKKYNKMCSKILVLKNTNKNVFKSFKN